MGGWKTKKEGGVTISPRLKRRLARYDMVVGDKRSNQAIVHGMTRPGSNKRS